jgi:glycerol-3-phosphate dehydrogenase (NAD(P)+)
MTTASAGIAVLGAGSWGTALSLLLARNGHDVILWGHLPEAVAALNSDRENQEFLPGFPFPENLTASNDLGAAVSNRDILVVVPSHAFRTVLQQLSDHLQPDHKLAWATKGLEMASGKLLHQVAAEELPSNLPRAVISGPTFAKEVAKGLPTAVTVAANDSALAEHFAGLLRGETFRPYTSSDMIGLELGGAIKNVLAIAAGISDGMGFGANSRAALITRGLAEMIRLGDTLGGHKDTFMGLGGVGDLVLTCTDNQSRNRRLGLALGQGKDRATAEAEIKQVVEGAETAREIHKLGKANQVDMPICEAVYHVLYKGMSPGQAVQELLHREPKAESI